MHYEPYVVLPRDQVKMWDFIDSWLFQWRRGREGERRRTRIKELEQEEREQEQEPHKQQQQQQRQPTIANWK